MPCACKVNKQIAYLAKHYGMVKEQNSKTTNIRRKVKNAAIGTVVVICTLPFLPIFLVSIPFIKKKNNGKISLKELLPKKKNV